MPGRVIASLEFKLVLAVPDRYSQMDVPFNKSGASSRAHYQIVRSVENAPQQAEKLLVQETERIRRRSAGKVISTSELRKDLIILLYCLNSSAGSVSPATLAREAWYLFVSEVMPPGHELELMLVNTVRKDLTSHSNARITLALESLISSPSADVVPAVQARCVELLSHSSLLAKEDDQSKSDYAKELLPPVFVILRRVVKVNHQPTILECFRLIGELQPYIVSKYIVDSTSALERNTTSLNVVSEKPRPQSDHPVALIRHFLSSRILNEHYLFLSCLACLEPALWAGKKTPENSLVDGQESTDNGRTYIEGIPPVLDQWEVERVLGSLESDDDEIRALTLRILNSLDPTLIEGCYERALSALQAFSPDNFPNDQLSKSDVHGMTCVAQRTLELAFATSLGVKKDAEHTSLGQAFAWKMKEITDVVGESTRVNGGIVEIVLNHVKKSLFSFFETEEPDRQPVNATFLLIFLALSCELAPALSPSSFGIRKIIHCLAVLLDSYSAPMQEAMLLSMTRLVILLPSIEMTSPEIENASRLVRKVHETVSTKKNNDLLFKRCEQLLETLSSPQSTLAVLEGKDNIPLPEFALLLDHGSDFASPIRQGRESISPSVQHLSPFASRRDSTSSLSQSKLRYDAYAPPPVSPPGRFGRIHSHSTSSAASGRSSIRSSSRASNTGQSDRGGDADLMRTVTAGELTLAVASGLNIQSFSDEKGKLHKPENPENVPVNSEVATKLGSSLITLESPFTTEPLVDMAESLGTPPASSPFEELWFVLAADEHAFGTRGWCDDPVDIAICLPSKVGIFCLLCDLKISLRVLSPEDPDSRIPSALLRLHEEGDGSCLWQAKCVDAEMGSKVKELMR
ncbi:hypothetical protein EW145_g5015 [Phellinidium pouzarii]|uniref:OTU domain-containing protein n=1 Tax=Phellinidium pouzarii TaxID=167371 RepID=A0A4S4L1Q9_9AGAM|nr:hypothetical protein EW145_g5015 [Phellinidium pouzarii]